MELKFHFENNKCASLTCLKTQREEMVEILNEQEFEQTLGDSEGQGNLVCCSPWGFKELKQLTTEEQQYFYHMTFSVKHNFLIFFLF